MNHRRVVIVLGTRPEAIKLSPVIRALRSAGELDTVVVSTGQHRRMLDQVLSRFGIAPDVDLDVMRPDQRLGELTARVVTAMGETLLDLRPDLLLVQGDTTTVFAASVAAFYARVPVAHVEAGLRSYDPANPFPEEMNRRLTSTLASIHFAPTERARRALLAESIPAEDIVVTGNTVVDALEILAGEPWSAEGTPLAGLPLDEGRWLLVTSHRRESWGRDLEDICGALRDIVTRHPDAHVVYPVHLNPNVQGTVKAALGNAERIHLVEPLDYLTFLNLMRRAFLILTDSGGVQEEAPSLSVPLLCLRRLTERPEAFDAGLARVVGTSREAIVRETSRLLDDPQAHRAMRTGANPYGDGRAAHRVARALSRWGRGERPLLPAEDQFRHSPPETPAVR